MTGLRVGTRGSELALRQTRWVCRRLAESNPALTFKEVIIQTHGDRAPQQPIDADFPAGGFVGAIEQALLRGEVDVAVHSYKDLPTAQTPGLIVAAVPTREAAHDLLICRVPISLAELPGGFRIGTSSPRRAAQLRRVAEVAIVPIRGNVPTRIAKVESGELDAVALAAAGVRRLGLSPRHEIELPIDPFVPAPAQGALAVQTRSGHPCTESLKCLENSAARRAVEAERAFLRQVNAGCHTPVGAHATVDATHIRLRAQLFTDDASRVADGVGWGDDPVALGRGLADTLRAELGA